MLKKCLPLLLLCTAPVFAKPVLTVYTYDSFAADWGPGPGVKKAFEAVLDAEDYTPNDIADLMSVMTEALQEIAPDVFEDGDDDEDGDEDDYEEEDLDEDLDDDFGYDDEDE